MSYKKRISILILLIAALLAVFWLGSRYPAIDEKAAMAGEVVLEDVLSFEAAFQTGPQDPLWKRIGASTLNWVLTNRQGMTFGVLFASLVLTLLQLWPKKRRPGRAMRDILKGILIGAPLGVCVNCAAPIAYGMRKEGVRHETSLATMFASPTLNIVVVTMMFSLLPMYMAVTKLAVTFLFLLVALPLLLRLRSRRRGGNDAETATAGPLIDCELPATESWIAAVTGLAKDLWRNLLFILVRTVPLMFLAGFLGAAMANLLPLESFAAWQVSLGAMALVAVLGTFAPVPIAFDIVVVQALLVVGLPPEFAMALLVTLGAFSIYPLLLVSKMLNWRFSMQLFVTVSLLGIGAGYFAGGYEDYQQQRNQEIFTQRFKGREHLDAAAMDAGAGSVSESSASGEEAIAVASPGRPTGGEPVEVFDLSIERIEFNPRSQPSGRTFEKHAGRDFGLISPGHLLLDLMLPFSQGRGIASGDFNGDGWPDLAIANNQGITLYRNLEGERFVAMGLPESQLDRASSLLVAFVDMNNDGCLDLFTGAFGGEDYFLVNDCRGFESAEVVKLGQENALMTQAASFADHDRDGDLDLLKGSWFFLIPRVKVSPRNVNYLAENLGDFQFRQEALDEIHGASLSVLLSDFDGDGFIDRIIGNDYQEPDIVYRGLAGGEFENISGNGIIPISTLATMSIDTADIDNDLDLDIFQSGKVNDFSEVQQRPTNRSATLQERRTFLRQRRKSFQQQYCSEYGLPADRERCEAGFVNQELIRGKGIEGCLQLPESRLQDECMVTIRIKNSLIKRDWAFCQNIPQPGFEVHQQVCDAYAQFDASAIPHKPGYQYLDHGAIPQSNQGDVLLVQQADGRFVDMAEAMGVFDGHWAWNAKFADLDNDEWQDLFLVNGWWLETSMYSNNFFHNQQGRVFESKEAEFGLQSVFKQHAHTYLDLDLDGDLDIVTRSLTGEMEVFINNVQDRHSMMFEFRDDLGNFFGIGNRVTIHYGENNERHQVRELKSGGGFVSFDAPVIHFGLGEYPQIGRLVIDWSSGGRSEVEGPFEAGARYVISRKAGAP